MGDDESRVWDAGFDLEPNLDFIWSHPDRPGLCLVLRWEGGLTIHRGLPFVYAANEHRREDPLQAKPGPPADLA